MPQRRTIVFQRYFPCFSGYFIDECQLSRLCDLKSQSHTFTLPWLATLYSAVALVSLLLDAYGLSIHGRKKRVKKCYWWQWRSGKAQGSRYTSGAEMLYWSGAALVELWHTHGAVRHQNSFYALVEQQCSSSTKFPHWVARLLLSSNALTSIAVEL